MTYATRVLGLLALLGTALATLLAPPPASAAQAAGAAPPRPAADAGPVVALRPAAEVRPDEDARPTPVADPDGMPTGERPSPPVVIDDRMGVRAPTWSDYLDRALPPLAAMGAAVAAIVFGLRLVRGPRGRRDGGPGR